MNIYKKMHNLDNIFSLFSSNEGLDGNNTEVYVDFQNSPVYRMGMYKKLILNHITFNKKIVKFFQDANKELDECDLKEAGEYVTYNRAWFYIKNIDLTDDESIKAIEKYSDEHLDTALKMGISFFQEGEEYEKCAFIKKILDKSKEFTHLSLASTLPYRILIIRDL